MWVSTSLSRAKTSCQFIHCYHDRRPLPHNLHPVCLHGTDHLRGRSLSRDTAMQAGGSFDRTITKDELATPRKQHPTTDFTSTSISTSPATPSGSLLPAPVQQFSLETHPQRRRRGFPSLHKRVKETTQEWTAGAWRRLLRQFEASPVPPTSEEDQPETENKEGVEGNELLGSWWGSTKRAQALAEADEIDEVASGIMGTYLQVSVYPTRHTQPCLSPRHPQETSHARG
ncbi:hypothetical protein BDW22DRAFT_30318 [Trametopsis cervina]|nr:hypothetical protein BDW22DRAFT_30318 [Trametopsis cervina]